MNSHTSKIEMLVKNAIEELKEFVLLEKYVLWYHQPESRIIKQLKSNFFFILWNIYNFNN